MKLGDQQAAFGYRIDEDGKREQNPEEQRILKEMYRRLLDGESREQIASALRAMNLTVPVEDVLAALDGLVERRRSHFAWGPDDITIISKE